MATVPPKPLPSLEPLLVLDSFFAFRDAVELSGDKR